MEPFRKAIHISTLLLILIFPVVNQVFAQIPDDVILSLKSGNAKVLAGYFNQNIELVILDDDNVYSKAQAEQIVGNFFSRHQPERFSVLHQRGKEGAQYVIGNLSTRQETFRVYFLLKTTGDKVVIHQFRIEKQE
jgi:ABC-type hemin transport system substrate-binding protein